MSNRHPVIAMTGSSGAGTTTFGLAMQKIIAEENINAVIIEGDSFHRYTREQMASLADEGRYGHWNHFSVPANHISKLNTLFADYAANGSGMYRHYVHDEDSHLIADGYAPGTFTRWQEVPEGSDCLFYEGLHGGLVAESVNLAAHVDLLIGVTPIVNLEWIQKIHRDTHDRGYSKEAVVFTILNRMEDYFRYIVPQFERTHINFQRIPTVDTSDPFNMQEIPSLSESMVVIHFRDFLEVNIDNLLTQIPGAFTSRADTLVVPGIQLTLAMNLIIRPRILGLIERKKQQPEKVAKI